MRSLIAFVAFGCSFVGIVHAGPVDSVSALGLNLHLDRVEVWKNAAGLELLGWPKADAEALLDVFETRLPLLLSAQRDCETLVKLKDQKIEIVQSIASTHAAHAAALKDVAAAWKDAADAAQPSVIERVLRAPELWFVLGAATATAVSVAIAKGLN